ncbi:YybS family protein [Cytobacillus massiliigabonensis]|uniref:YybS family protein n=1 Tax=Cytobacillus massiliigabonensis TaxID=1871011 RepID=UPI000C8224A0|nr:YybS family protein [Cytobacillus massiliigabonensis]
MNHAHKLTQGALCLAIFAVLILITIFIPVLGLVTNLFLAVPFILFAAKNTRMDSFVFLVAAIILSMMVGTVLAIPFTLSYGIAGLVIGHFIQEKRSRAFSFIASTLVFLMTLIVEYAVLAVIFKMNIIEELIRAMRDSLDQSAAIFEMLGRNVDGAAMEQFEAMINMIESLTPSLFVMTSVAAVLLIELVSFPIVKRFGVIPQQRTLFKEITLPKSILWYYLVIMLASFILKPEEGDYWYLALVNLSFILQLCMVVQGLAFIFYICHKKGIPKAVPIIAAVFTIFPPILLPIVRILGIIDLGFELRKRLENKNG